MAIHAVIEVVPRREIDNSNLQHPYEGRQYYADLKLLLLFHLVVFNDGGPFS